jgi:hypothetical protein
MKKAFCVIVILLAILLGCASTHWELKSQTGKYSTMIPKEVPKDIGDWVGRLTPIYQSEELSLFVFSGVNPKNENETSLILFAVEADAIPHIVGLHYRNTEKGIDQYYVDIPFMEGKPACGKLTAVPDDKVLGTSEIIKIRTGKEPGEVSI